ncbi:MAG TPA: hypothetical protein VEZ48_00470 [Sphingomonadaceae bacterium]|nr:hypothetical protein [Sphingomonadaceae bacterium]
MQKIDDSTSPGIQALSFDELEAVSGGPLIALAPWYIKLQIAKAGFYTSLFVNG